MACTGTPAFQTCPVRLAALLKTPQAPVAAAQPGSTAGTTEESQMGQVEERAPPEQTRLKMLA